MRQEHFDTREAASVAAAETILALLSRRLEAQGEASLVVSGGTTPGLCFEALSRSALEWDRVSVVLSDERWVAPESDDSNEKLVRTALLTDKAREATLLPVFKPGSTPEERSEELATEIRSLPFPFACSLLGMGEDGHFASLFPDAAGLDIGLDSDAIELCIPVQTAASPYPRISLTLSALSRSDEIVLLIFGDKKLEVLEAARNAGSQLPVARLLLQKRAPVNVFWAP